MREEHLKHIFNKLRGNASIKNIEKIKRLPFSLFYIDWTIGGQLERDYMYKIETEKDEEIYCIITSFFGLFIIKSRFFKKEGKEFSRMRL